MADEETNLVTPHGGSLVNLLVDDGRAVELEREAAGLKQLELTPRQLCDYEQLVTGGFSPLTGFMNRADYEGVRDEMRLEDGTLWPMPIVLDVDASTRGNISNGDRVALMHPEGVLLAVLTVGDVWEPEREDEAIKVFGTMNEEHPGVDALLNSTGSVYVGGSLEAVRSAQHHTYAVLRQTPAELRAEFASRGWDKVVAFQTRNPMHRAHVELTRRGAESQGANLLIHPVVGLTKPGDVEYHTRVRCYQAVIGGYPENSAGLSLLQLAMRMGGPREAVWHAIVRKNYGCSHLIVGRDHAGPGSASDGTPFYGPYEAQELVEQYAEELGIGIVSFQMVVYDANTDRYATHDELGPDADVKNLSGTDLREMLNSGAEIPSWFSYPEVVAELRKSYPPMSRRGFVVLVSGNNTGYANAVTGALQERLLEVGTRPITSLEDAMDTAVKALVAGEVARNGGAVLAVDASSTESVASQIQSGVGESGQFLHVNVSLGGSPYDTDSDIAIDGDSSSPGESAQIVIGRLEELGLISE